MTHATVEKLTKKIDRLEQLVRVHIEQEQEKDWLDTPKLVKKLDQLAKDETSLPESMIEL